MRKLISPGATMAAVSPPVSVSRETAIPVAEQPVLPEQKEILQHPPERPLQFACDKLTWNASQIRAVKYNKTIQAWMDYDINFHNWVKSCVMQHAENSRFIESRCLIPDQWRSEIGHSITIVTANAVPGKRGEVLTEKKGVYEIYVME